MSFFYSHTLQTILRYQFFLFAIINSEARWNKLNLLNLFSIKNRRNCVYFSKKISQKMDANFMEISKGQFEMGSKSSINNFFSLFFVLTQPADLDNCFLTDLYFFYYAFDLLLDFVIHKWKMLFALLFFYRAITCQHAYI